MRGIKVARVIKDITQIELAEMLGVTVQTISNWERNEREPSVTYLKKMSELLDTTIDQLVNTK